MTPIDDTLMLNMVKRVVEQHGCEFIDVDFENHIIDIQGSDEAKVACALGIEDLLSTNLS
jgi:hypothetical protein